MSTLLKGSHLALVFHGPLAAAGGQTTARQTGDRTYRCLGAHHSSDGRSPKAAWPLFSLRQGEKSFRRATPESGVASCQPLGDVQHAPTVEAFAYRLPHAPRALPGEASGWC